MRACGASAQPSPSPTAAAPVQAWPRRMSAPSSTCRPSGSRARSTPTPPTFGLLASSSSSAPLATTRTPRARVPSTCVLRTRHGCPRLLASPPTCVAPLRHRLPSRCAKQSSRMSRRISRAPFPRSFASSSTIAWPEKSVSRAAASRWGGTPQALSPTRSACSLAPPPPPPQPSDRLAAEVLLGSPWLVMHGATGAPAGTPSPCTARTAWRHPPGRVPFAGPSLPRRPVPVAKADHVTASGPRPRADLESSRAIVREWFDGPVADAGAAGEGKEGEAKVGK